MLIEKRYPVADQCPGLRTSEEGEAGCVQGYLTYTVYRLHSAQHTAHQLSVINKYHHSVVSVLLLCCRCQLNKMTPKLNQTCLVNVKERVSYLCLGKVYRWMDLNVMITYNQFIFNS